MPLRVTTRGAFTDLKFVSDIFHDCSRSQTQSRVELLGQASKLSIVNKAMFQETIQSFAGEKDNTR